MSFYHPKFRGYCLNCDQAAPGKFCSECGQSTHHETPSLWHFIHEYLHHYIALEGKLIGTLRTLIFSPGVLSQEYLCGRRQKYVGPLALYLSISFVFFLTLVAYVSTLEPSVSKGSAPNQLTSSTSSRHKIENQGQEKSTDEVLKPSQKNAPTTKTILKNAPYAYFAFIPLYAFLLARVYRQRLMNYGEHLVFAMHLHAATFLVMLLFQALPSTFDILSIPSILWHQFASFRRFYRGRWLPQLLRYLTVSIIYSVVCFLVIAITTFIYSR